MYSVQVGSFKLLLNRNELPLSTLAAIRNVRVEDEINLPTMFSFSLSSQSESGAWQGINLDTFSPGDEVSILLGLNSLENLVSGEITAVEPSFGDYNTVTIRGFDSMYKLRFGRKTATYESLSDADIVSQVAGKAGLTVSVQGNASEINEYVLQNNLTDYDFILQRTKQLNYEILMRDSQLIFRPSAEGNSPTKVLQYPRDIQRMDLNLRVPTEGSAVTVYGYNVETNEAPSVTVSSAGLQTKMGGRETGYDVASDFPASGIAIERPDISSIEALQEIAKAQYQQNLARFIQGEATLIGDPDLTCGINIKITGLSDRFDGTYYIYSSVHSYDESTGYSTQLKIRRTGI